MSRVIFLLNSVSLLNPGLSLVRLQVKEAHKHKAHGKGNGSKIPELVIIKKLHQHPEAVGADPEKNGHIDIKIDRSARFNHDKNGNENGGNDHNSTQRFQLQHPAAVFNKPEHNVQAFVFPDLIE
jgi:hypothetical protein